MNDRRYEGGQSLNDSVSESVNNDRVGWVYDCIQIYGGRNPRLFPTCNQIQFAFVSTLDHTVLKMNNIQQKFVFVSIMRTIPCMNIQKQRE